VWATGGPASSADQGEEIVQPSLQQQAHKRGVFGEREAATPLKMINVL
jgi:hypothetical protein